MRTQAYLVIENNDNWWSEFIFNPANIKTNVNPYDHTKATRELKLIIFSQWNVIDKYQNI